MKTVLCVKQMYIIHTILHSRPACLPNTHTRHQQMTDCVQLNSAYVITEATESYVKQRCRLLAILYYRVYHGNENYSLPLHLPSYIPLMCSLHGTPISNSTYQYMLHIHSGITLQHIAGNTDYYSRYVKYRATLLCVMPA